MAGAKIHCVANDLLFNVIEMILLNRTLFIRTFLIRRLKLNQETGNSEMFSVHLEQSLL